MKYVLLTLAVAVVVAVAVIIWILRGSLPGYSGEMTVPDLAATVEVRFDGQRRPYVTAASLPDALFAQGWLHADNRLWQMELLRRAGGGRMAQALGAGLLATDEELWRAGVPQLAAVLERNASRQLRTLVARYVAGINARLAEQRFAPPEFLAAGVTPRPWEPADVFAVGALIAFQSAGNFRNELLRLALAAELDAEAFAWFLPDETGLPDFPYVLAGTEVRDGVLAALASADAVSTLDGRLMPGSALGSNGWVVAPHRSASGRALFAFDSHDDLSQPNLFYEVHLFFAERGQLRGWSLPGLPGVINGFNRRLAWGLTNIGDTQDLFIEEFHPDDPDRLLGPAGYYGVRTERVEIAVAGRDAPAVLTIRRSRHGPLIHDDPPLALRWTGHDVRGFGLDGLLGINLADDWPAFSTALDNLPAPVSNATYADTSGNIAFRTAGLVPRRRSGKGLVPLRGADAEAGWDGYVPMSELPRRVNPSSGYLAAANARIDQAADPLISADNAPGYRMRRLHQVLGGPGRLTLDDMRRLQTDWYNSQAALLLPGLLEALQAADFADPARTALEVLRAWHEHPVNGRDLAGPVIYEQFYVALADAVFAPHLSVPLLERLKANNYVLNHALDRILLDPEAQHWWQGERAGRIQAAFERAIDAAVDALGGDPAGWRWDALQTLELHHELAGEIPLVGGRLNLGPYPWGGGPATLGRARYRYDRPFLARAGATVRVAAEMASPISAHAVIPGGQSGHPLSRHYSDQMPTWLDGDLYPLATQPADVDGPVLRLQPR